MSFLKINIKTLWLACMQAIVFFTQAQNFVSNGYFEIYSSCPTNTSDAASLADGWLVVKGTPDYDNACSSDFLATVPDNTYTGYQQDCCGGAGYTGVYVMQGSVDDREFMQTKLIDTLKAGHKYLASMYVSRANRAMYGIATMGMLFTDTAIVLPSNAQYFTPTPQVRNTALLADSMNWMVVQDTFIAFGNEVYLTIGNFNLDATSDTVKLQNVGFGPYYYIDGVSVYDVATLNDIEQNKNNAIQIKLYPNPSVGKLYISNFNAPQKNADIEITDITGKLVYKQLNALNNSMIELNLDVTNGVYLVKIINSNGSSQTQKLIINK